jgi:hypothetical protein
MKKPFFLASLIALFATAPAMAQPPGGGDPQQFRQRMIERTKPGLMEKARLTDAEAGKVLDIYFGTMQQRRQLRTDDSLSEEERKKKMDAINEETTKKYKEIPLTEEKVKAVNEYFEEMRRNMQNRGPQGGSNSN